MSYAFNKLRARTTNNGKPSLTDQSQARDTDINIIVGRFLKTGRATGPATPAINGDFSHLPQDLRGFIEEARSLNRHRGRLPDQLKDIPIDELLALTPEQLTTKLAPPATPPAKEEEPKT